MSLPPSDTPSSGRYRLLERLGEGGMSVVWRAVSEGPHGFSRVVAIKLIRPDFARDPRFRRMLITEARVCGHLNHPAIAQVHELDVGSDQPFLVMDYIEGVDLGRVLRRATELDRRMPQGLACYLASEIAGALAYAHALRDGEGRPLEIVHRDISPSNVMITHVGSLKLLDFGIARAAPHVREERTRTGLLKGKAPYMSPEQADGRPLDRRSDLFALGVVLHECLTGEPLFDGDDDFEVLRKVRTSTPPAPSALRPEIAPEVDAVVRRLLARSPEARYADGEEVVAALAPIVHQERADAAALRQFVAGLGPLPGPAPDQDGRDGPEEPGRPATVAAAPGALRLVGPDSETRVAGSAAPSSASLPPSRRWAAPVAAGVVLSLALAGGALRRYGHGSSAETAALPAPAPREAPAPSAPAAPSPSPSPSPPVTAVTPAPPTAARAGGATAAPVHLPVHLVVRGTPGAEVLVDGQRVGVVPLDSALPRATKARALSVRHAGYQPLTQRIEGDRDVTVDAPLRRAARPARGGEPEMVDPFAH